MSSVSLILQQTADFKPDFRFRGQIAAALQVQRGTFLDIRRFGGDGDAARSN